MPELSPPGLTVGIEGKDEKGRVQQSYKGVQWAPKVETALFKLERFYRKEANGLTRPQSNYAEPSLTRA